MFRSGTIQRDEQEQGAVRGGEGKGVEGRGGERKREGGS